VNPGPVFVAGLERSGTSLAFALLASHHNIAMTRRTNLWTYFYGQYGDLADDANANRCIDMMLRYKRLVVLDVDGDRLRRDFLAGERTYTRLFRLLYQQVADRAGRPRWGDKSLNIERYADQVLGEMPDARIVHMVRDPRDRYASVQARWLSRWGGIGAGTAEWLSSIRYAERNQQRWPNRYLVLRYEDLVTDPEHHVRALCVFLDEPFDPDMLTMDGARDFRDRGANSSYGSRRPGAIATDSIGRYRDVLTPGQIAFVERVAAGPMARLGYQPDRQPLVAKAAAHFAVVDLPVESARLLGWRARTALLDRRGRPLPAYRLVPEAAG
jgi:hypothetical protein